MSKQSGIPSGRRIHLGLGAVLVAGAALGVLGLMAVARDTGRAREKLRLDAQEAVRALAEAFETELAALREGRINAAVTLELAPDGGLLPLIEPAPEPELRRPRDPALLRFQEGQIDSMVLDGQLEQARDRLARLQQDQEDPWLAAWAATAEAALARRAADEPAERAALEGLVALPLGIRDARGLSRQLAARERLLTIDGAGFEERLALYAALVEDHRTLDETATAELAARVRTELESTSVPDEEAAAALSRWIELDAARARLRALADSGVGFFLFDARSGELRLVEAPPDPLAADGQPVPWIVVRADGEARRGFALELERLVARAIAHPELALYERAGLALALGSRATDAEDGLALRTLPLPGGADIEARAKAIDLEALLRAESRRLALTAALTALALLVIVLAGLATTRAVARESRAAREREAFVAAVSHELRTPLAATRLLAELMAQGGVEEEKVVEFARRIGIESERLSRLVSSILDLARLEGAGGDPSLRAPLDLREVAAASIDRFAPIAEEAGFEVVLRDSARPLVVRGERDALIGALLNLLDNARKHADEPHAIELALEAERGRARITVSDRGRGVPPAERERIFAAFARVGDELTRDRQGVGLGLALVQRIAAAHGGTVGCAPRPGGGSVFTIEVPLTDESDKEGG